MTENVAIHLLSDLEEGSVLLALQNCYAAMRRSNTRVTHIWTRERIDFTPEHPELFEICVAGEST